MLLTLSPFAVDSLTPSYRHSQHPPRALIPHLFSQLQAKGSYMSRPILVPGSISFMHPLLGRPLLLYPSPHANIISFFRPSTLITCPKNTIFCYVATTGLLAVIPVSLHWMFTSSLF